jgi:hypothetical protein
VTAPQSSSPPPVRFGQASNGGGGAPGFGRLGTLIGVAVVILLAGGLIWSGATGHPASAQKPQLFGGSLVLEDTRNMTVVDVATGRITVALSAVNSQVLATSTGDVQAVPVSEGTFLVNKTNGRFNLLGKDNYVLDAVGPGVGLGPNVGPNGASALGAGPDAYIVRYTKPKSTVALVDQATVEAGAKAESVAGKGPVPTITPRGFNTLDGPATNAPGMAVVNGPDLWVLVGSGARCQVQQLRPVPAGHQGLVATDRVTLPTGCDKSAVESAGAIVGVASPGAVRIIRPSQPGPGLVVRVPATDGATRLLPISGASGSLWFLADASSGWSLFGVNSDGRVTGPSALRGFDTSSAPVVPVLSAGYLYTLDQNEASPTLWTILPATGGMAPVKGQATYPQGSSERAVFTGAQVVAVGPRVVFNNPQSKRALIVFTDGSHPPAVLDKSQAVTVSAAGPVDVNVQGSGKKQQKPGSTPTTQPVGGVQAVNQQATCAATTQKPYSPQITSTSVSSGTVLISWSYQLLDQSDCEPDSWAVRVKSLSSSHQPAEPVQVVNGQQQLLFTGLRPATTYQATVTAYINQDSYTASNPVNFTTSARGPDAPTSVQTTSDGHGDWVVSWTPCSAANCYVPADSWSIVGTACGAGFVGQPPTISGIPGGQTTVTIDAADQGLLGDSLSFSVQGSIASGLTGNPASDHECTQAWSAPDPAAITLAASGAPSGQSITATLQVTPSGSPTTAFGSLTTEFVYSIDGHTVAGPTTATRVTIPGLAAGTSHSPSVRVYPAGHPAAAVTVTGQPFTQNVSWPAVTLGSRFLVSPGDPNVGSVAIQVSGLPPGLRTGQIALSGNLTCGSTVFAVGGGLSPSGALIALSDRFDLIHYGSGCTLKQLSLSDTATPNPYGTSDPLPDSQLPTPVQPAYGFSAALTAQCQIFCLTEQITVSFVGPGQQPTAGGNWTACTGSASNQACQPPSDPVQLPCFQAAGPEGSASFPMTIDNVPQSCFQSQPNVLVTWEYLGMTEASAIVPVSGTPGTTTTTTTTTSTTSTTSTTMPTTTSSSDTTPSDTSDSTTSVVGNVPQADALPPAQSGPPTSGPPGAPASGGLARLTASESASASPVAPAAAGGGSVPNSLQIGVLAFGVAVFAGRSRRIRQWAKKGTR